MEIVLFNRYLVRAYEYGFILSEVLPGKPAVVADISKGKQGRYYNFGRDTYPGTFEQVLKAIKQREIAASDVRTMAELKDILRAIDNKIEQIQRELFDIKGAQAPGKARQGA